MNWTFSDQYRSSYYIPKVELLHQEHHKRKKHAMIIFDTDPRDDINTVDVTVLPSINSSTNACLPAHNVSTQE